MSVDLNSQSVTELRKMLREQFPSTKGQFSAFATKEICIAILSGVHQQSDYIVDDTSGSWVLAQGAVAQPAQAVRAPDGVIPTTVSPEPLEAGDHGKAKATDTTDKVSVVMAVKRAAAMIRVMDPHVADVVEQEFNAMAEVKQQLAEALAEKASMVMPVQKPLSECGKIVSVCGVDCPVISTELNPMFAYVPQVDPHYQFNYWRAERRTAASMLRQGADDLIKLLLANWRLHLVGPPGVGKTSVIEQFAARVGWPCIRMQGDKDVTTSDFLGEKTVTNGNIEFVYGVLPTAMKIGAIFIADEIDYFPPDCRTALNPVTEPNGKLVLTANGGEVIVPHPNFRIVATSNTKGFGDDTGLYPDAKVQNAALLSRFNATFGVTWLSPGEEAKLLVAKTGISKAIAKLMAKVAADTRAAAAKSELLYALTTRHLMSWASGASIVGLDHAFALCVLNKVPDQDATVISEITQRHMGNELKSLFDPGIKPQAAAESED